MQTLITYIDEISDLMGHNSPPLNMNRNPRSRCSSVLKQKREQEKVSATDQSRNPGVLVDSNWGVNTLKYLQRQLIVALDKCQG